jgi:hypothetical protein
MFKIKITTAAVLAVLALSAVAVSTASAGWFIGGEELPAGSKAALSTKTTVTEPFVLNSPKLSLKISCPGLSGVKPEIIGTTKAQAEELKIEGCSEVEPKTCKVETATISTEPIIATPLESEFPADKVLLAPKTGTNIAGIDFVGSCSLAGEKPLNGKINLNAPTLQEEATGQPIEALGSTEGNNSLEIGGNKAYLEKGKTPIKLASEMIFGDPAITVKPRDALILNVAVGATKEESFTFTNTTKVKWLPKARHLEMDEDPVAGAKITFEDSDCLTNGAAANGGTCKVTIKIEAKSKGVYKGEEVLEAAPSIGFEIQTS